MKKLALSALAFGALSLAVACGGDDGNDVQLPDANEALPDSGNTGGACNAIMNTGCDAGEKCAVRFITGDTTTPGTTECMANGTVAIGGACEFAEDPGEPGTDIDNCMAPAGQGVFCRSGICTEVCAAGAAGTCPMRGAQNQSCVRLSRTFDDQATPTGVCALQCDPLEKSSCAAGEGCYLVPFDMESEFICANAAVPDPPPVAGQPCPPDAPGGGCFLNGSPPGSTIVALNADMQGSIGVIAPYCVPANTSSDNGVSGTVGGVALTPIQATNGEDGAQDSMGGTLECTVGNLQSGGDAGVGPDSNYGCRFYDSAFSNTGNLPNTYGFCAPQNGNTGAAAGASGWNQSVTWSLQGLVDDINDNMQIDDVNNLCFGCVSSAVLDAALGGGAIGRQGVAVYRSHLPKLPAEQLRALEAKMGVTVKQLDEAAAKGKSLKVNPL